MGQRHRREPQPGPGCMADMNHNGRLLMLVLAAALAFSRLFRRFADSRPNSDAMFLSLDVNSRNA